MVTQNQSKFGEGSAMPTDPYHTPITPSSSQPQKTQKPRKPKRKDTRVPQPSGPTDNVTDKAIHKELGDRLIRAATTVSSIEPEHDNDNITKTQSKATHNESSFQGANSSSGPRCQETMGILLLKLGEDASKQERRIDVIDADDEITLVNNTNNDMFDVDDLGGKEVFVAKQEVVSTDGTTKTITTKEITLAQAFEALKTLKPMVKGIVFHEPEEHVKPKKKDQIRLDEEATLKLQVEFDKEERLERERERAENVSRDANREITVTETFHLQTNDELSDKELKQIEADDQSIQTILLGLPKDIYAAVDICETAQEIWLQPEWSRHVTIVHQTKDFHTADYTQLYDFLKYNQKEIVGGNGGNQFRQYAGQNVGNPTGYNDVIENQVIQNVVQNPRVQNAGNQNGLIGVQWIGNQNQIGNGNLVAAHAEGNAVGQNKNQIRLYNCRGVGHYARNCTVRPCRRDAAYLQTQLLIAQKEEAGIQLQAKEYDLMAAAADLDEIEKVNANCILMANLQQASTSGTQTDSAPIYDTDGSAENDNDVIFEDTNMEQGRETVEQHPANFEETPFKLNYSTPTNNNQRISSNPRNRQIAQPGMNMGQDRQMQMVGGNGGNQFRQYAGQNTGNQAGYNDVIGNQVIQNAVHNPRVQNVGNLNGLIGVQRNGNQNQIGNGNLVAACAEGNGAGQNGNQIRCYNCIVVLLP
nr:hypothetical protein [Tanacetum cinerariifolium]